MTHSTKKYPGFTIVELLIVIVVIGILAAITIVAFNGVQNKANIAALQSDLSNASKKLQIDKVNTGAFPDTLAAADGGKGITGSGNTVLNYVKDGTNYCLAAARGGNLYKITNTATVTTGTCNPVITNLIDNPSVEADTSNWASHTGYNGARVAVSDGWAYQATRNATSPAAVYITRTNPIPVTIGTTYTASVWVTSSAATSLYIRIRDSTQADIQAQEFASIPANTPTRLSVTGVIPPTVTTLAHFAIVSQSASVGSTLTLDKAMFTEGSTLYAYSDGNTPGWSWTGTFNNSISSGVGLL